MQDDNHAPLPGLHRFSRTDLPALIRVRDVPVLTATRAVRTLYNGGPQWPEWQNQLELRHGRSGAPININPQPVPKGLKQVNESFIWGGNVHRQFGHQIAEYSTRVLQAAMERPHDRLLFGLWPGATAEDIPPVFWQVMNWYGVEKDRIKIVDKSFIASEIWVAGQSEQLGGPGPSEAHLQLLARNTKARDLHPIVSDVLYVTRVNMLQRSLATTLGEGYLVERLQQLGVSVLAPETEPLAVQMAHYAGAKTLVFAQGSAVHGRQLLGHIDQDIVILTRVSRSRLALPAILPRCTNLIYAETTRDTISRVLSDGPDDVARAISIYDTQNLFRIFAYYGVDLSQVWDDTAFRARCEADLQTWARTAFGPGEQCSPAVNWVKSVERAQSDIERLGFEEVLEKAGIKLQARHSATRFILKLRRIVSRTLGRTRPRHKTD